MVNCEGHIEHSFAMLGEPQNLELQNPQLSPNRSISYCFQMAPPQKKIVLFFSVITVPKKINL